ncbi:MAG: hypothetical protein GXP26_06235 [Planctomycetes bacterium]|nr:hypothetical protein [Planctomycetota bacterium]
MHSELLRIPVEWSGVPIFGVGVLLALWLVGGGIWMVVSGKRTAWSAETMSYLPGLVIGAIIIVAIPRVFPEGLPIRGYGVMVLLGACVGLAMAAYRTRQAGLNPELIFSLAFGMFVCGILGARLFYVIEYWDTRFNFDNWPDTLIAVLKFTEGGLVVYGALIGAMLAFGWFVRRQKLPALAIADLIAPSLLAGLALGRIGCLLNGCCYGGETERPWAVTFPQQSMVYREQAANGRMAGLRLSQSAADDPRPMVLSVDENSPAAKVGLEPHMKVVAINGAAVTSVEEVQALMWIAFQDRRSIKIDIAAGKSFKIPKVEAPPRSRPVHPTQIYSAVNAGLLSWLLWSFFPFRRRDGEVTALMLTIYPISRFLLEIIRVDESPVFGTGLSISQNISILLFFAAIGLWVYLSRQPNRTSEPSEPRP